MCYGPEGIGLDFESLGNVVLVKGRNYHDLSPDTGEPGSNGTGKSAVFHVLCYALFGKTAGDKINHSDLIHKKAKKNLRVEVVWDRYRVVRTRKPDGLRLWESADGVWDDSTEVTCGAGAPETQKKVEAVLGMNYKTFVSVVVFDDRSDHYFLECDAPTKRVVVENLLSLEKYREYGRSAKSALAAAAARVKALASDYDRLLAEAAASEARVKMVARQKVSWREQQAAKADQTRRQLATLVGLMGATDAGRALADYNAARDRLAALNDALAALTDQQTTLSDMVSQAMGRRDALRQEAADAGAGKARVEALLAGAESARSRAEAEAAKLRRLEAGVRCDRCLGEIDPRNAEAALASLRDTAAVAEGEVTRLSAERARAGRALEEARGKAAAADQMVRMAEGRGREVGNKVFAYREEALRLEKVRKPDADKDLALLEQRVRGLEDLLTAQAAEAAGPTPYEDILRDAERDAGGRRSGCDAKRAEVAGAEAALPYLKFWVYAFGDDGIRKFVIDGIVPALNEQVRHWLDVLIAGNIRLTFDNMLDETIERVPFDDDPFVYSAMSGGERRRMNLAVIQALAHVQMLNCGAHPSLLLLDEVASNLDVNGVKAVYNMITELALTRQVFVTTHDELLLDLLQGCQTIELERRDGVTRMVPLLAG